MKTIPGFDYRTQKAVEFTLKEWRELMVQIKAKGGRVCHGCASQETWLRAADGTLLLEVYRYLKG